MIVNNVVYVDGKKVASPASLDETYEIARELHGIAWIGLYRPNLDEIRSVEDEFGLPNLAVEDAIRAHQRPKLERYGATLFAVLRPARYIDETEEVEFGELHVFIGPNFVVTIRHAETPDLSKVRLRLEHTPDLLRLGPEAILYAILDEVVDGLAAGFDKYHVDAELQRYLRDVKDHSVRLVERVDSFRAVLQNALTVQTT